MQLGEPLDEGQADAHAAARARALPEGLEDLVLDVVRHPGALVLHDHDHPVALLGDEHLHGRSRGGMPGRVVEEVLHDPLDLRPVHVDEHRFALDPDRVPRE